MRNCRNPDWPLPRFLTPQQSPPQRAKLPCHAPNCAQVMIHVPVAPAEPLPLGKLSKHGMGLKLKVSLSGREPFDQGKELR